MALALYGYALELLQPLASAHGAAAIEAACVQLSRARLCWAAGDVTTATADLEAASGRSPVAVFISVATRCCE